MVRGGQANGGESGGDQLAKRKHAGRPCANHDHIRTIR